MALTSQLCSRCRYCRTYNNENIPVDKRLDAIQVRVCSWSSTQMVECVWLCMVR